MSDPQGQTDASMSIAPADDPESLAARPRRRWARWVGYGLAIALLIASIWFAVREGDFAPLLRAPSGWVVLLLVATALSAVGFNGLVFWLVNRPFTDPARPLRLHEMQGLLAASALLNYTPIKAGLVGRVAYLKRRHGIGYGAQVLIHAMIAGAMLASYFCVLGATLWRPRLDGLWWAATAAGVVGFALVGAVVVHWVLPRHRRDAGEAGRRHSFAWTAAHLAGWIAVSLVNVFVTAGRWWVVGRIMDERIAPDAALLMSVTHNLSAVLPANGLGMREWLIGVLFGGAAPGNFVAISLIDRAAEAIVLIALGLLSIWWLRRRGLQLDADAESVDATDAPEVRSGSGPS